MTITQNVDPIVYKCVTPDIIDCVNNYINEPMTATWFSEEEKHSPSRSAVTAEKIYCWMIMLNIPFECQKWHLNRLMTLIRVCDIENRPKKKMSKRDTLAQYRALNAKRCKARGSKG
ncbi:MAG: hypothetical protein NC120_06080 [Ruminococcus sp.]|nr:hypothetical protein [Ruminococcus sp.]